MKTKQYLFGLVLIVAVAAGAFGQPTITRQPANQTASLFANATFRVTAIGDTPLSYQWRFNDADLIGKTTATLLISNVQRADAGHYSVVVTNLSGSVTSQMAVLAIVPFNAMYCFGFSWTDTHNCPWEPPTQYWNHHVCNGPMWPEFVSTNLRLTYVEANNYARCAAGPTEILNQVINWPASQPKLSIYFLWAGSGFDPATAPQWAQVIHRDVSITSNTVNRLYTKGARQIVIQTHEDDGKLPGNISQEGANSALLESEYDARFDAGMIDAINAYAHTKPDLRIVWVDMFSKLNNVLANPGQYGFTQTIVGALNDTNLTDKSFSGPGADYVFWNELHGTTKLHALMAGWILEALTDSIPEELQVTMAGGSPTIQMNHLQIGRDYTLQTSSVLSRWQDVQTFTAAAGTNEWTQASVGAATAFYRLKWQPWR